MRYQMRNLSLFHVQCVGVPNPKLHRVIEVFSRREGLKKSKYILTLQKSWGVYSITYLDLLLLCYVTDKIYDWAFPVRYQINKLIEVIQTLMFKSAILKMILLPKNKMSAT